MEKSYISGIIISNRFYNKLPADLQQLIKTTGKKVGDEIRLNAREENRKSIGLLEQNGIEFMFDWDEVNMDELLKIRDDAAVYLEQTDYIPAAMFAKTKKLLTDYRERTENQSNEKPDTAPPSSK